MLMQTIFIFMMIFLVSLFPALSQPLSMGLVLLLLTLILSLILGPLFSHFWISYTMILVLLGALLVIFIYVSLIASNEQFLMLNFSTLSVTFCIAMLTTLWFFNQNEPMNLSENHSNYAIFNNEGTMWLKMFYSEQLNTLILFLVCYLFLTLVIIVKNTNTHNLSLRKQS